MGLVTAERVQCGEEQMGSPEDSKVFFLPCILELGLWEPRRGGLFNKLVSLELLRLRSGFDSHWLPHNLGHT